MIEVEADVGNGLPQLSMVGYLAAEVREAGDRVRTAIKNSGFHLPPMKITVNLSPADIRKGGTAFDLPIALAILGAYDVVDLDVCRDTAFLGELGLDGSLKGIRGVLPLVMTFREKGIRRVVVPPENIAESLAVDGIQTLSAENLRQMVGLLRSPQTLKTAVVTEPPDKDGDVSPVIPDFSEINGQNAMRRATEVAVAGRHNLLYIGPPGSGKSMMASRIPGIMPALSAEEQMEISKIYSICGMLPPGSALIQNRPFRAPHHTITIQALIGGGQYPKPGEVTLASRGVLFLDELPEFKRETLEILRQPLEDKKVTISRVNLSCTFPADFMLVAAANPCPCGFYPDRNRCSCTEQQVRHYLGKISRPLLDRIDVCVEAAPVSYQDIREDRFNESSAIIRGRVEAAREIQQYRFRGTGILFNSEMGNREVRRYCALGEREDDFFREMFAKMRLSARGYTKILKVARTIADLEGSADIKLIHLSEAVSYRDLEERYWGRMGR